MIIIHLFIQNVTQFHRFPAGLALTPGRVFKVSDALAELDTARKRALREATLNFEIEYPSMVAGDLRAPIFNFLFVGARPIDRLRVVSFVEPRSPATLSRFF